MIKKIVLALLALLALQTTVLADARSGFEEGLRLYRNNDIDGAIAAWEKVVKQGEVSGPLYYNLGNAYYRSKEFGMAILNYERARKLIPRDRDVSTNLDLSRMATVDKIEPPVRLVVWNWIDSLRDQFNLSELAALLYLLGAGCAALMTAFRILPTRFRGFLRAATGILVVIYGLSGIWYVWRANLDSRPFGIVMASKTDAFSAPDEASKQLFSLHEGTKIQCGESLSGWTNVRLADGRRGWIRLEGLEGL